MLYPTFAGIDFDIQIISLIFTAFFVGGLCKGAIGFGLPIVVISLLSMFVPVSFGIALNVIPPVILNMWQSTHKASVTKNFMQFWPVFLGLVAGIAIATLFIVGLPPKLVLGTVGVVILVFCANSVWGISITFPKSRKKPYGFVTGILCGIMGGVTSVSVPPLIVYLTALKLQKDDFVSVLGLYFVFASASLIVAFSSIGWLNSTFIPLALACTAIAAVGMFLGQIIRNRLDQKKFYNGVLLVLALISLNLIRRAIF